MREDFFLAISDFLSTPEEVLDHLVDHRAWTKDATDSGKMLFTARQDPPTGAVLAFRAPSRAAAEEFVAQDPFAVAGVVKYEVIALTTAGLPWRSAAFDAFMRPVAHEA